MRNFEKRSAYIEFVSQNMIKVVTPYLDKSFTLDPTDHSKWIDLVKLKKVKPSSDQPGFYGLVMYDKEQKHFHLCIYCRTSEENHERIDIINISPERNKKRLQVSIVLPD